MNSFFRRKSQTLAFEGNIQMRPFHKRKCKVLHLRRDNPRYQGQAGGHLNGKELRVQKELDTKLNMRQRCVIGVQGCVKGSVTSRTREVVLPLHSALVRAQLECHIQFWAPHYKRHMDVLE